MTPERILNNIWTFKLSMPNNPLKWLNCYAIKAADKGRCLLIDTGFNLPVCREELVSGMRVLELEPTNTDVFLTHFHADHIGNACILEKMGCRILMGKEDYSHFLQDPLRKGRDTMLSAGMDAKELSLMIDLCSVPEYNVGFFTPIFADDGEIISYGGHELRCVLTPGHTKGHMCLYAEKEGILFCGDHVLYGITPNICSCGPGTDALGSYLKSLERVKTMKVELALPAHRAIGASDFQERIEALNTHYMCRLNEAEMIVRSFPEISAYDIAAHMKWKVNCRSWAQFPLGQKYFAVSEVLSHLDHLCADGVIERHLGSNGVFLYFCEEGRVSTGI